MYFRDYNFAHFNFAEEPDEKSYWYEYAPALGSVVDDFELQTIDGAPWRLSDHSGRPVVVEFGSFTCPIFCGRIDAMERLASAFPEVAFVVVYVREAHPGEVTSPHTLRSDKIAAARRLLANEQIAREVLIDDLDGRVHRRFGANYNSVFVIDPQSRVVLRRRWNEPSDVKRTLSAFANSRRPVPSEAVDFGSPCDRRPPGEEILRRGGADALADFAAKAPPTIARMLHSSSSAAVRSGLAV